MNNTFEIYYNPVSKTYCIERVSIRKLEYQSENIEDCKRELERLEQRMKHRTKKANETWKKVSAERRIEDER